MRFHLADGFSVYFEGRIIFASEGVIETDDPALAKILRSVGAKEEGPNPAKRTRKAD